jgi:putative ABC transport system permease protein
MTRGSFLTEDVCTSGSNVAVISEQLANKLYKSLDVVGNGIILTNQEFRIIGVYSNHRTLMSFLADDGLERVYVPYSSIEKGMEATVNTLAVSGLPGNVQNASTFEQALRYIFPNRTLGYVTRDYSGSKFILVQLVKLPLFALGMWCMLLLAHFLVIHVKNILEYLRKRTDEKYPLEIIRTEGVFIGLSIGRAAIYIFAVICIYILIRFKLYIPSKYIPYDNIFDIQFYLDQLKSDIQAANSLHQTSSTLFGELYHSSMTVEIFCVLASITFFAVMIWLLNVLILTGTGLWKSAWKTLFAIAAGTATGLMIAYFMGFCISLPARYMVLSLCFIPLYVRNKAETMSHNVSLITPSNSPTISGINNSGYA